MARSTPHRPRRCSRCYGCRTRLPTCKRRFTGPDGRKTLCSTCCWRYRNLRLPLFWHNGLLTARVLRDAKAAHHVGFKQAQLAGGRDLSQPVTAEEEGGLVRGLCMRCRQKGSRGCRTGPDGWRTLCISCFEAYRGGGCRVWKAGEGWSVVERRGVWGWVVGFERTSPREHFLFPLVELGGEGDEGDSENEVESEGNDLGSDEEGMWSDGDAAGCEEGDTESEDGGDTESEDETENGVKRTSDDDTERSRAYSSDGDVVVKAKCGQTVRRFTTKEDVSFEKFCDLVGELFGVTARTITYVDEDGDKVTVSSGNELAVLLAMTTVRITVA